MQYILRISLLILLTTTALTAQISIPEIPHAQRYKDLITTDVPTVQMPAINISELQQEDAQDEAAGLPPRFGKRFETNFSLSTHGRWDNLPNGGRVWRFAIESPGALSINLTFNDFFMPRGGRFFVFTEDFEQILGAFSSDNNKADRKFATSLVFDEKIILGYYEPPAAQGQGRISVDGVIHGYRKITPPELDKAEFNRLPPASTDCFIDAACPEGDPWRDEIKSVAVAVVGNGTRWCTGALLANTAGNQRLLFLTANNCLYNPSNTNVRYDAINNPILSNWVFQWNYEKTTCNGSIPNSLNSTTGAIVRANSSSSTLNIVGSNFALLELTESPIAAGYDVYFSGWDATGATPQGGTSIHHPNGAPKKIAVENAQLTASTSNPITGGTSSQLTHWEVPDWDGGALEGSSQGAPLFNNANGRIVGQFSGGFAECNTSTNQDNGLPDYFGQFAWSWLNNGATDSRRRLKDLLDPGNTGQLSIGGYGSTNSCSNPQVVTCDDTYSGDTNDGQSIFNSYGAPFNRPGKEYVHTLTPNTTGLTSIELKNLTADIDLFILTSCSNTNAIASSTNLGTNAENIMINLNAGQTYYLFVDARNANVTSTYDLIVGCMDPCNAPIVLDCGEQRTGSTFGMNNYYSNHGNSGAGWTGGEAVFEFTTIGGSTTIDLTNLNTDLDLFLLDACDPVNNEIARSTVGGLADESIQQNLAAGTYYIMVDGFNGAAGSYTITLDCPSGGTCASPNGIVGDVMYQGDTDLGENNFQQYGAANSWDGKELVYIFTPDETGPFDIELSGLSNDLDLFVLDDCNPVNAVIASSTIGGLSDELVTVDLVSNNTYYIIVDGFANASSAFNLMITTPTACDSPLDIDCTPNGNVIFFGIGGSTIAADNDYLFHGGNAVEQYRGGEAVYIFYADQGAVDIRLENLDENLDLFLLSDCEQVQNEVARSTNGGTTNERIQLNNLATGVYYIMIDGYEDAQSDFSLFLQCNRPPILLRTKVALQGPFDPSTNLMNDEFRDRLSTTEPFTGLGFQHVGGGGETINPMILTTTGNDAIVDWVFVELRDSGNPNFVLATRSALLQRDGDVVEVDGFSPLEFPEVRDNYYIGIKTRSNLGVMTNVPNLVTYE
ncbi:MAG: PPC domain-containing protein [Bacteroidota bacterium]